MNLAAAGETTLGRLAPLAVTWSRERSFPE